MNMIRYKHKRISAKVVEKGMKNTSTGIKNTSTGSTLDTVNEGLHDDETVQVSSPTNSEVCVSIAFGEEPGIDAVYSKAAQELQHPKHMQELQQSLTEGTTETDDNETSSSSSTQGSYTDGSDTEGSGTEGSGTEGLDRYSTNIPPATSTFSTPAKRREHRAKVKANEDQYKRGIEKKLREIHITACRNLKVSLSLVSIYEYTSHEKYQSIHPLIFNL